MVLLNGVLFIISELIVEIVFVIEKRFRGMEANFFLLHENSSVWWRAPTPSKEAVRIPQRVKQPGGRK
jgi:hypothetical protein